MGHNEIFQSSVKISSSTPPLALFSKRLLAEFSGERRRDLSFHDFVVGSAFAKGRVLEAIFLAPPFSLDSLVVNVRINIISLAFPHNILGNTKRLII